MAYTSFMRGDNTKMTNTPYTDGLIFLNTEEQALYLDDNNERIPMGGAGTGGHIIENNAGTDMTERTNLQFGGVYVSDDETNDRTKVNVTRNMSKDAFDQLTTAEKLGVIVTSNDPNDYIPFSADMVEYDNTTSGMTATDVQDAIDELNADMTIDLSGTSLPASTDFNSLIQQLAEVVFPSTPQQMLPVMTSMSSSIGTVTASTGGATSTIPDNQAYLAIDGSGSSESSSFRMGTNGSGHLTFTFAQSTAVKYIKVYANNPYSQSGSYIKIDVKKNNSWYNVLNESISSTATQFTANVNYTIDAIKVYPNGDNIGVNVWQLEAYN